MGLFKKTNILFSRSHNDSVNLIDSDQLKNARDYIQGYWSELERAASEDSGTSIGLPNQYLAPAGKDGSHFEFSEMYYWDSYFTAQSFMLSSERKDLVIGIIDNLFDLLDRFGVIPNASRVYFLSRSQPPFLSSFVMEAYQSYDMSKAWLKRAMGYVEKEYKTVWMGQHKPHDRRVFRGLSRYYDVNMLHDMAEAESGWDMTTRFERRCLDFIPVDLNCYLYQYETDLARIAEITGLDSGSWLEAAESRRRAVTGMLWHAGFFYDYDYKNLKIGSVKSLAAYAALWSGLATPAQAKSLVDKLHHFEHQGGLATTDGSESIGLNDKLIPRQWSYPNGWAPLHYMTIIGLKRYGYDEGARRIALKWLQTNLEWFNKHGEFVEKYNVVKPGYPAKAGVYPTQVGFGWTNAVFESLSKMYL